MESLLPVYGRGFGAIPFDIGIYQDESLHERNLERFQQGLLPVQVTDNELCAYLER